MKLSHCQTEALGAFLAEQRDRYGVAPRLKWHKGRVRGNVVTEGQRDALAAAFPDATEVGVLADAGNPKTTLAFYRVYGVEPLRTSPGGKLASEVQPWDPPVRRLSFPVVEGQVLVQTACQTLGWMRLSSLEEVDASAAAEAFIAPRRPRQGEALPVSAADLEKLADAARSLAARGPRYRWGGRDEVKGLDCSALTQLLFARSCAVLLPRNSRDQRRYGLRVGLEQARPGALVFASHRKRNISHVALILGDGQLVHACLSEGRVLQEDTPAFLSRYRVRIARQIGACS